MKKTLKDLQDELALKSAEADKLVAVGDAESRNLTNEEHAAFEAKLGEVRALETQVNQLKEQEAFQAGRAAGGTGSGNRDTSKQDRKDMGSFNLNKALFDTLEGRSLTGIEAEVTQEGEKRALADNIDLSGTGIVVMDEVLQMRATGQAVTLQNANPGDLGGVLVEKKLQGVLEVMQANTFLEAVGARFMTGLTGNLTFPVQETVPGIQELTEIQEMIDTEILFSSFDLIPTRRGVTVPISRQTLKQTAIDMQSFVIEAIGEAFAQKLNVEAIINVLSIITSGNGNLLSLGTNGGAPTYEMVVALEALIENANHLKATPKYLTNSKVKAKLKTTQKFEGTNGTPVWGDDNTLNGYKAVTSNLVPGNITKGTSTSNLSAMVLGDWSKFVVGRWGGVEYIIDPYSAKRKAQIEVTANAFWGMKATRVKSFSGAKDIQTL